MEVVKTRSFARAGFLGNPSDGYYGKTISFAFTEFGVDLALEESKELCFRPGQVDDATFSSPLALLKDLRLYGYYGGIRMLKAVSKLFFEYCLERGISFPEKNFTASYRINIPRLVGLSGSSAICSAMLKALMRFYGVEIPIEEQPTLIMCAERDELGIACGLQDRVAQIYNGLTFMDFRRDLVEATGHGAYERLDPGLLPNVYVAYDPRRAEESGKAHGKVRKLFQEKNHDILAAMSEFADIAQRGRDALVRGDFDEVKSLIDANFDLRNRIFNVAEENRRMVLTARKVGASAKFAGSGGAIVGTFDDEVQYADLVAKLSDIGCAVLKPTIARTGEESLGAANHAWRNS